MFYLDIEKPPKDGMWHMREKAFEKQVKEYLNDCGCWVLKTWSNGIQREGVPDLLICCNGFFIGVELKNETGRPSALQLWNIEKINNAGGFAFTLYPDQFEEFKKFVFGLIHGMNYRHAYEYVKKFNRKDG